MAMSTSCSSNFLRGNCQKVNKTIGGKFGPETDLLAGKVAPVLDVSDGESVGGLWIRHLEVGYTVCEEERGEGGCAMEG